jgi:hypothetical protein
MSISFGDFRDSIGITAKSAFFSTEFFLSSMAFSRYAFFIFIRRTSSRSIFAKASGIDRWNPTTWPR